MSTDRNNVLSRRRFLGLAAATAAGGALAACAPGSSPSPTSAPSQGGEPAATTAASAPQPASSGGLQLTYWLFWTQYSDLVDQFRETQEFKDMLGDNTLDIQVGVEDQVFKTNIAAGTPPDIGATSYDDDYMVRGVCLPIDDLVAQSAVIKKDDFIEGNWNGGFVKGVQYGVPANECFVRRGLDYNEQMLTDAGLDPDNVPLTWEELFEWHKTLTKFDDNGNMIQFGLDPYDAEGGTGPGADGFFIGDSFGFDWFDPDTGEFNLDCPEMAEGLDMMGEFVKYVGVDNLTASRNVEGQGTWGGAFNAQVQAMIIEGYWHPGETAHEKPEVSKLNRCTWAPVPQRRAGTKIQFSGGHKVLLFRDAQHPKEAFPIAEFLQSKAACDIIFNTIGWLPAYKPYLDQVDSSTFPGLKFYFDSVDEATEWHESAHCPIAAFVETKYQEIREAVYRETMTGAEGAKELQAAAEDEWQASGNA